MPNVTIYIRNEDMPKWEAIENRPEWLHEHLNGKPWIRDEKSQQLRNTLISKSSVFDEPNYTEPEDVA